MLSLAMNYNKDLFDINKQNKISNVENIKWLTAIKTSIRKSLSVGRFLVFGNQDTAMWCKSAGNCFTFWISHIYPLSNGKGAKRFFRPFFLIFCGNRLKCFNCYCAWSYTANNRIKWGGTFNPQNCVNWEVSTKPSLFVFLRDNGCVSVVPVKISPTKSTWSICFVS